MVACHSNSDNFISYNRACRPAAIAGTTISVPYHVVKPLQRIWRSGTCIFHLQGPDLQMGGNDST